MIDSSHSSGNSSLFQIQIISLWIALQIVLPPALINSAGIWLIPGYFLFFSFPIANSTSKALGSGTSGSTVCISACLTSLPSCTFNSWLSSHLHARIDICHWIFVTENLCAFISFNAYQIALSSHIYWNNLLHIANTFLYIPSPNVILRDQLEEINFLNHTQWLSLLLFALRNNDVCMSTCMTSNVWIIKHNFLDIM